MEKPQNGNRVGYNKLDNIAVKHMEKIIFHHFTDLQICR